METQLHPTVAPTIAPRTEASDKSTYFLLLEFIMRSKHQWAALAEQFNLTIQQLHTLNLLSPTEPRKMNGLCSLLMCDASNVTGIIDRLVSQGLVDRRENPEDRRVKMVALTVRGKQVREDFVEAMVQAESGRLAPLTAQELAELRRILLKLSPEPACRDGR